MGPSDRLPKTCRRPFWVLQGTLVLETSPTGTRATVTVTLGTPFLVTATPRIPEPKPRKVNNAASDNFHLHRVELCFWNSMMVYAMLSQKSNL